MDRERLIARLMPDLLECVEQELAAIPAEHTWYTLEECTHHLMRHIGQRFLQRVGEEEGSGLEGPSRPCSDCGGEQAYHDQHHPLTLLTSVGTITLPRRASYRCQQCHTSTYPLDERLGVRHAGRTSRYLQELMGWLLAEEPIATATETLEKFLGITVPVSQMRRVGEGLGTELDAEQAQRVEQLAQETQGLSTPTPIRQPPSGERRYAAPDGWMYCTTTTDDQGTLVWKEAKTVVVYEATPGDDPEEPLDTEHRSTRQRIAAGLPPPVRPHEVPHHLSYVVRTQGTWQDAGPWFWTELHERGAGTALTDVAVIADGGEGLRQMADTHLHQRGIVTTRILDIGHAQQHLWDIARLLDPDQREWLPSALVALEHGAVSELLDILTHVAATLPAAAAAATTAQAYFATRYRQLDYPTLVQHGYQIGSGFAESACKRFGTDRMKGTGMRWTPAGAQSIATLRALRLSRRWSEVTTFCAAA